MCTSLFCPFWGLKKKIQDSWLLFLSTLLTDMRPLGPLTCDGKSGFVCCTSSHFSLFLWKVLEHLWCSSPSTGSGIVVADVRGCFYVFPFSCALVHSMSHGLLHDTHMNKQLFLSPWWLWVLDAWALPSHSISEETASFPYVSHGLSLCQPCCADSSFPQWKWPHLMLWRCFTSGMCPTAVPFSEELKSKNYCEGEHLQWSIKSVWGFARTGQTLWWPNRLQQLLERVGWGAVHSSRMWYRTDTSDWDTTSNLI